MVWVGRDRQSPVAVYDMERIRSGHIIPGPALIDTVDTTLWAPPHSTITLAAGGTLVTRFDGKKDRAK
jgi:hypothetical protein